MVGSAAVSDWQDFHEERSVGKVYDLALLRRLIGYLRPYKWRAALALALILMSAALQLVGPLLTAIALDLYVSPSNLPMNLFESLWIAVVGAEVEPTRGIAMVAVVYVVSLVLTFGVLYAQMYILQLMGQLIMLDLRQQVFSRLQELEIAYFDRHPLGRLVARATSDIAALNELFTAGLVSVFGDVFLLLGIITMLFLLNVQLAFVSLAIIPLLFLLTLWFKRGARGSYRDVRRRLARLSAYLQEHITGMSVVQLFGREKATLDDFTEINAKHRDANVRAIFYYAVYFPSVELINAFGVALLVLVGGGGVLRGALTIGVLVAFLQYVQRFYRPLADLSEKYNVIQAAMASAERVFELLDTRSTVVSSPDGYSPEEVRGAVELQGVTFSYGSEVVLDDISFRIEPGETVAIVGHTGAGKSTLTNLVMRLYDVQAGHVRIDDVDVRDWDLQQLRGSISVVLQDVFLFSGTIADNICMGTIDEERMRWAAAETDALDFINRLPDGFETVLAERGGGLSVGQKQLISFARALAFDPRILILDEATAAVDTETEQRIQKALERLLADRTSLVIAHRLSTVRHADRILVLHKGRLVEQGPHAELMSLGGVYHKLYQLQARHDEEQVVA